MRNREWKRVYHSEERVLWIKGRACDLCGRAPTWQFPSDNAHVTNGGTGRKADYVWIISACSVPGGCHWQLDHGMGKKAMERKYNVDLKELARSVNEAWESRDLDT